MKNFVMIMIAVLCLVNVGFAVEVESYLKLGTSDSVEKNRSSACAHKLMVGIGFNFIFGDESPLKAMINTEMWTMAEPVDRDFGVPHDGVILSGKLSYDFELTENTLIYPFAGVGFENWRRNSPDDVAQDMFYGDLCFFSFSFGNGLKYKNWYAEAECFLPFWTKTDSGQKPDGEWGGGLNAGYIFDEYVRCGLFYTQKSFGGDGTQTDFKLSQYGFFVGYTF